jgi:hypothetical protein
MHTSGRLFFACSSSLKKCGMVVAQIFAGGNQKAAGAGRRVTNHIVGRRFSQLDHEMDEVPGVRNWPFCPAVAILPSMYS